MCGLYSFILSFSFISFIFLDFYLFLKYEGIRPVRSEMQKKTIELGVDIVVFPGFILTAGIARILSMVYNSVLPFAFGMFVLTFFATVISLRLKNQPERFMRLTGKITKNFGKIVAFYYGIVTLHTVYTLKSRRGVKGFNGNPKFTTSD